MTTQRADRKARMTAAAAARTTPTAPPAGSTAIRTKPYRITLDLEASDYLGLKDWLGDMNRAVRTVDNPATLSLADLLRATIRTARNDPMLSDVIADAIRRNRDS